MTDLNEVVLMGRLVRNSDTKPVGKGNLTEFSIAVNRSTKVGNDWKDEVSYFDVKKWQASENLQGKLIKGAQVTIKGSLNQERWQDQNGANKSRIVINAENVWVTSSGSSSANVQAAEENSNEIPF